MNRRTCARLGLLAALISVAGITVYRAGAVTGPSARPAPLVQRADEKPASDDRLSPQAVGDAEKAIRAAAEAFSTAFNKGDADSLLACWTADAEYVSEAGQTYRGKEQLRVLLEKSLTAGKGMKHSGRVEQIRFLTPDVAREEGSVTLTAPEGETESTAYVALWVRSGGKWLLSSVRDVQRAGDEAKPVAYGHLRQLAWLVGEWQEKKSNTQLSCRWGPGQACLLQEWIIPQRDGAVLYVSQRIGWDPVNGRIRSWTHDSTGGYGEGQWQRQGNTWVVLNEGLFPDGKYGASINRWKYQDGETTLWAAHDRTVDGQPLPDIDATYTRKAAPRKGE